MNRIPPLARVPLRYGVLGGVLGFLLLIGLYYIDPHPYLIPVFLDFRILLLGVFFFFSLKELRDYYFEGLLFFWQGMISCFILTASFAIVAASLIYAFTFIEEDFVSDFIRMATQQAGNYPKEEIERLGRDVYEAGLKALQQVDGLFMARRYLAQSFGIGLFVSIIISVILRRQPKY